MSKRIMSIFHGPGFPPKLREFRGFETHIKERKHSKVLDISVRKHNDENAKVIKHRPSSKHRPKKWAGTVFPF